MRSTLALVLAGLTLVTGCNSSFWHPVHVDELPLDAHALVITTADAYELDDIRVRDGTLTGNIRAAWKPTRVDRAYLEETDSDLRRGDPPATVAQVLGWQPEGFAQPTVAVSLSDIRFVRVYDSATGSQAGSTIGGIILASMLIVVLGIALLASAGPMG